MKHFTLVLVAVAMMCMPVHAQNKVKNLYASSSSLKVETLNEQGQTVRIHRYLYAGYNTICLPMTLNAEQLAKAASGVTVEKFVGIGQNGSSLNLYFMDCTAEGIEAGVPYLVFSPKSQYLRVTTADAEAIDTNLKTVLMSDNAGNRVAFGSSWDMVLQDGRYGIPAKQNVEILESVLVRTEGDKAFLPTRCGFTMEGQAAQVSDLQIQHVASMADVTAVKALKSADALVDVYDLKGNLVKESVNAKDAANALPRGIYVIGGEKVIIK